MAGLLLTPSPRPAAYSNAATIPNQRFGLYRDSPAVQHVWNPTGNGLALSSFDYPIAYVHADNVTVFQQAADANAASGHAGNPLHAVEIDNFMYAADNSETCLRRRTRSSLFFWPSLRLLTIAQSPSPVRSDRWQ